jgi:streptogramin lyase
MFYMSDQRSARIVRIDAIEQSTAWSVVSPDPAVVTLTRPCGVRFADGRLFIVDMAQNVIVVVELASGDTEVIDTSGEAIGALSSPRDVAVSADRVVIADTGNHRVVCGPRNAAGAWTAFGTPSVSGRRDVGDFLAPVSVHIDSTARILVADAGLQRLIRIDDPTGNEWTEIGLPAGARPYGLAGGPDDTTLVVDQAQARVMSVAPDGAVTTLLDGSPGRDLIAPVCAVVNGHLVVADAATAQLTSWTKDPVSQAYQRTGRLGGDPGPGPGPTFRSLCGLTIGEGA